MNSKPEDVGARACWLVGAIYGKSSRLTAARIEKKDL